jgi:hypothetical protein
MSGVPIAHMTVQTISKLELESEDIINMLAIYDKEISEKLTVHNEANDFRLYREDEDLEEIDENKNQSILMQWQLLSMKLKMMHMMNFC